MKKFLSLSLTVLVACSIFAGCSSNTTTPASTNGKVSIVDSIKKDDAIAATLPDEFKKAGQLTIGVDDDYPPMEYRDDKDVLVGFDVDFGNAIGKKLGLKIVWTPTKWDGVILALQSGKFDMLLSSLSDTPEREKQIVFSKPYIQGGPVLVVKKGDTSIKTLDDLKGKIVGVQTGTTGEDAVKTVTGLKEVKEYDVITSALQDLAIGRTQVVAADDQVGRYYVGLAPDKYEVVGKLHDEPFGIGYKNANAPLRDVVQKAIDELQKDGTLSKISMQWFKKDYYKN